VNMNMPASLLAHFQATHNFFQQIAASPLLQPPAPAAPAPVENQLILMLKLEVIPEHLHKLIPVICSWRKKINILEPGFWLVVAINKPVPLSRLDLIKDMDLPGDFTRAFQEGLDLHFPELDILRKNRLMESFMSIMNLYVLYLPQVNALMAAAPINVAAVRAVADQMIKDCQPMFKQAREVTIQLDTESIVSTHGGVSGAMYQSMTQELNDGEHLGDVSALKQVNYHSQIHKGSRVANAGLDFNAVPQGKGNKCRRCHNQIPFGGFKAHNKTCPGKGVGKKKVLGPDGKPIVK